LEDEKALIANAKLQGIAMQFVQGRETLINDAHLTDSVKRCQPSITILGYKMSYRKKESVLNLQIGVGDHARKLGTVCDEDTVIHEEVERRLVTTYING
jgi:hypothetical protein